MDDEIIQPTYPTLILVHMQHSQLEKSLVI